MPASMIRADSGGTENVNGSSIATVVTVPMPGNTPTSVPIRTPAKQYARLLNDKATPNPKARLLRMSMVCLSLKAWPQCERHSEPIDEQSGRKGRKDGAYQQSLGKTEVGACASADDGKNDDCGDQAKAWEDHAKEKDRHRNQKQGGRMEFRECSLVRTEQRSPDKDGARADQQHSNAERKEAWPHLVRGSDRVLVRSQRKERAESGEHEPCPEILSRTEFHHGPLKIMRVRTCSKALHKHQPRAVSESTNAIWDRSRPPG